MSRKITLDDLNFLVNKIFNSLWNVHEGKANRYWETPVLRDFVSSILASNDPRDPQFSEKPSDSKLNPKFVYRLKEYRQIDLPIDNSDWERDPKELSNFPIKSRFFVFELDIIRKITRDYSYSRNYLFSEIRKRMKLKKKKRTKMKWKKKERKRILSPVVSIQIVSDINNAPIGRSVAGNLWRTKMSDAGDDSYWRKPDGTLITDEEAFDRAWAREKEYIKAGFERKELPADFTPPWKPFRETLKEMDPYKERRGVRKNQAGIYGDLSYVIISDEDNPDKEKILLQLAIICIQKGILSKSAEHDIDNWVLEDWAKSNLRVNKKIFFNLPKSSDYSIGKDEGREEYFKRLETSAIPEIHRNTWMSVKNNYCLPEGGLEYIKGTFRKSSYHFLEDEIKKAKKRKKESSDISSNTSGESSEDSDNDVAGGEDIMFADTTESVEDAMIERITENEIEEIKEIIKKGKVTKDIRDKLKKHLSIEDDKKIDEFIRKIISKGSAEDAKENKIKEIIEVIKKGKVTRGIRNKLKKYLSIKNDKKIDEFIKEIRSKGSNYQINSTMPAPNFSNPLRLTRKSKAVPTFDKEKTYKVNEIAEITGWSKQYIYRIIDERQIPTKRKGGYEDPKIIKGSDLQFILEEWDFNNKKDGIYERLAGILEMEEESVRRKIRKYRKEQRDKEGIKLTEKEALKYFAKKHGVEVKKIAS